MRRLQDQGTTQVYSPFGTFVVESHADYSGRPQHLRSSEPDQPNHDWSEAEHFAKAA